jgi:hypothetical protein
MESITQRYNDATQALHNAVISQPTQSSEDLVRALRSSVSHTSPATKTNNSSASKPRHFLSHSPLKEPFSRQRVRLENLLEKYTSEERVEEREKDQEERTKRENQSEPNKAESIKETVHSVRPWNYSDYLHRLKTFATPTWWFAKLDSLSPTSLARQGWTNVSLNTLQCEYCKVQYVDLDNLTEQGKFRLP